MQKVRSETGIEILNASSERTTKLTKALLASGVVAGPIYLIVGLAQALMRPGFDITRHDLSLLSNGDLGWIQITNLVVTGLLVIAGATGMRRALAVGWAAYSVITGVVFFAAFVGIASGSGQSWTILGFWVGVTLAWAWLSTLCVCLMGKLA